MSTSSINIVMSQCVSPSSLINQFHWHPSNNFHVLVKSTRQIICGTICSPFLGQITFLLYLGKEKRSQNAIKSTPSSGHQEQQQQHKDKSSSLIDHISLSALQTWNNNDNDRGQVPLPCWTHRETQSTWDDDSVLILFHYPLAAE